MNKYRNITLIVLVSQLLGACVASKSYVSFEVLQPSPVTIPEYVENVAILNKAPMSRHSFDKVNQVGLDDNVTLRILDTMVCNSIFEGLEQGLAVNELSYLRSLKPLSFRTRDTIRQDIPLTKKAHNDYFESYHIDALISLDYYKLRVDISTQYYDFSSGEINIEYRYILELLWRIYTKKIITPIDEYRQIDTMYYLNTSGMKASEVLSSTDIIKDGSTEFGYRYGLRLVPIWNDISRVVYTGREEALVNAAKATRVGDWDRAVNIWLLGGSSEDAKLAAKSLYNLSVYYEMEDELEKAIIYSNEAIKQWESSAILNHHEELEQRIINKEELLKQLR